MGAPKDTGCDKSFIKKPPKGLFVLFVLFTLFLTLKFASSLRTRYWSVETKLIKLVIKCNKMLQDKFVRIKWFDYSHDTFYDIKV